MAAARDDSGGALDALVDASLDAFDRAYDDGKYEVALACAQEAARDDPDDAAAHLDRAEALDALGHPAQARDAYARALALTPDDPDTLEAVADFLSRRATDDSLATAVLDARRGLEHARDPTQGAELAVLEASALNDLGRSDEALAAATTALTLNPKNADAKVERAAALVELDRFEEARGALDEARAAAPHSAKAAFYAGLLAERDGHGDQAKAAFLAAARLDPESYPLALDVSREQFQAIVEEEVHRLPQAKQEALATTDFSWSDLPALADLKAGDPVLSPTIVGVFRPGDPGQKDAILLYRMNLLRLCRSLPELHEQVRITLLHELGHHAGLDDAELRDRGL